MPPDATDTKRRILVAAHDEFAVFGLAGARMDRIAAAARANKRSIYVHFGPKETLFDLVIETALADVSHRVPFTPNDLAGYAGALFDYLAAHPTVLRIATWARLERPTPSAGQLDAYRPKVAALGLRYDNSGAEILMLVMALATAREEAPPALRWLADDAQRDIEAPDSHRALVVAAAAALAALP